MWDEDVPGWEYELQSQLLYKNTEITFGFLMELFSFSKLLLTAIGLLLG